MLIGVDLVSLETSMNNALLSDRSDALALACSGVPKAYFPRQSVSVGSLWCICAFRSLVTMVL